MLGRRHAAGFEAVSASLFSIPSGFASVARRSLESDFIEVVAHLGIDFFTAARSIVDSRYLSGSVNSGLLHLAKASVKLRGTHDF